MVIYGRIVRIDDERQPKRVIEAKPNAGRGLVRLRVKWEKYVEETIKRRGLRMVEV